MANTATTQAPIGNGQTLNADAARYWNALVDDLEERTGTRVVATEGTRTYARQKDLYDGYINGRIDPTTGRRYNPAWNPDSPRANHLAGRAVDVGSGVGYVDTDISKAFYAICRAYGFDDTVDGEPWHFEWFDHLISPTVRRRVEAHAAGLTPTPILVKELDMPVIVRATQSGLVPAGTKLMFAPGFVHDVAGDTVTAARITEKDIPDVTDKELRLIYRDHGLSVADLTRNGGLRDYSTLQSSHEITQRRLRLLWDRVRGVAGLVWK